MPCSSERPLRAPCYVFYFNNTLSGPCQAHSLPPLRSVARAISGTADSTSTNSLTLQGGFVKVNY